MINKVVLAAIIFVTLSACTPAQPKAVLEEQAHAVTVIQALDVYKNTTGRYPLFKMSDDPAGLELLVPDYLPHIPTTTQNLEYLYWSDKRIDYYTLSFDYIVAENNGVSSTVLCSYTSSTTDWYCQKTILQQIEDQ